jgi:hypothetical protein
MGRDMVKRSHIFATLVFCTATAHVGFAISAPANVSLNTCQRTVKAEGTKFVRAQVLAVGTCLQAISAELIRNNAALDNAAARTCIAQFRKINDGRNLGKSLVEKLTQNIRTKCDPTFVALAHTLADVTGKTTPPTPGPSVAVPINTQRLDQWCTNFGGDGSIDSVQEWINCIVGAHQCEAWQAIAEQYPRASQWLSAIQPIMGLIPAPATDMTRTSDAVNGLIMVDTKIDSNNDGIPDINCAAPPTGTCSTACCYQEFGLGTQVSCFQYTGTASEITTFTSNCNGKASTPPGAWNMVASAGVCGNPPDFPAHSACSAGGTPGSFVLLPKDSVCP